MSNFLLSRDLLMGSQIAGAAAAVNCSLVVVRSPDALLESISSGAQLVVIDLELPGLDLPAIVARLRQLEPSPVVVAYASHVQAALLASAEKAGCDRIFTRGQFHRDAASFLREFSTGQK